MSYVLSTAWVLPGKSERLRQWYKELEERRDEAFHGFAVFLKDLRRTGVLLGDDPLDPLDSVREAARGVEGAGQREPHRRRVRLGHTDVGAPERPGHAHPRHSLVGHLPGGFGVAKAVILGSSRSFRWEMHTQDNLAVANGMVYYASPNAVLIALDASTGKELWSAPFGSARYGHDGGNAGAGRAARPLSSPAPREPRSSG